MLITRKSPVKTYTGNTHGNNGLVYILINVYTTSCGANRSPCSKLPANFNPFPVAYLFKRRTSSGLTPSATPQSGPSVTMPTPPVPSTPTLPPTSPSIASPTLLTSPSIPSPIPPSGPSTSSPASQNLQAAETSSTSLGECGSIEFRDSHQDL